MADRSARLAFILSLTDKITAPLGRVKTSFSDLAEQGQNHIKTMGLGVAGMVGAGVAISQSLEPALEMNRALGEVRSLGVAEDALNALNRKSLEFSVAYGENARDFVASAYSIEGAIKGLSGSQLATFTHTSNLLAKATKTDADTMSAYVGTMYNLFKDQADAMGKSQWVERMGGQTALAVQLFRTDGAQLKDAFKEVGAIATTAGVDLAEQFAVLGTLSSTMEGGDAGGMYKALFENIGSASEKLGMKFTDQNGKLLPMLDILGKLQRKLGGLTSAASATELVDAFGGEGARVIGALAKDTGRLRNGLDQLGKVRGLESAQKMAMAMVDPWQQFGAAVQALRIAFGQALMPILDPLMAKLTGVAQTLTRWSQLFPNITRVVSLAAIGVLAFVTAMSGMMIINGIIGMLSVLVSPIALIVLGIAALVIAVGVGIYYWDELKTSLGQTAWFQALVMVLTPLVLLLRVFGALLNVLWVGLQQIFNFGMQVVDWLSHLEVVTTAANAIWDGFLTTLADLSPFGMIGSALKGLIGMLNKIPGVEIDASFAELPALQIPDAQSQVLSAATADVAKPPKNMFMPSALQKFVELPHQADQGLQARNTLNQSIPALSPSRPQAVPKGGLMQSIQNTTQNQRSGPHIEKVEIHNKEPMSALQLENMLAMAVGG